MFGSFLPRPSCITHLQAAVRPPRCPRCAILPRLGGRLSTRHDYERLGVEAHAEAPEPGRPPHHDRRRRPADVDRLLGGRARDAVRVRAAEPRQRVREPPLLRSRRRAADHGLHERGARPRPDADLHRRRRRPPPRVLALAGDVPAGGRAARRARDPAQRRQGPRLHGLDLLRGPARPADRAGVVPLRAAARAHARGRAARGARAPGRARRLQHRRGAPRGRDRGARRRRSRSLSDDRSPKNPYR